MLILPPPKKKNVIPVYGTEVNMNYISIIHIIISQI